MFNPYEILGLASTASLDEAKAAYRRLAQKNHPDRGGDEEKFKKIKGAWEAIDNGWVAEVVTHYSPSQSSFTQARSESPFKAPPPRAATGSPWQRHRPHAYQSASPKPQSIGPLIVEAYEQPTRRTNIGEFIARVSMAQAFAGFICEVAVDGKKYRVNIPPGIPHGLRFTVPTGENNDDVTVTALFTQSAFKFKGIDTAVRENVIVNSSPGSVYRTKDLSITLPIHLKNLLSGTTLKFESFLGEQLEVKVPSGHNPRQPLKVEGKGYVDWYTSHSQAGTQRGDVFVTLDPTEIPEPTVMNW